MTSALQVMCDYNVGQSMARIIIAPLDSLAFRFAAVANPK